jgi:hypothetical protein
MTKKIRSARHLSLREITDELQILEYIATNTREAAIGVYSRVPKAESHGGCYSVTGRSEAALR